MKTWLTALRPTLKEGVKSVIVASPPRTNYAQEFLNHIKSHHSWLVQGASKAVFSTIVRLHQHPTASSSYNQNRPLQRFNQRNHKLKKQKTYLRVLEKRLNESGNLVFFSLQEAENLVLNQQSEGKPKPEYLMLTDEYLAESRQKYRIQRLMQVAANESVKTRVISAESTAGKRVSQLGGIVCLAKIG